MYRKKGRGMDKAYRLYAYRYRMHCYSIFISYVITFGFNNPYVDKDYRILGVAFLLIDFFCGDNGRFIQERPKTRISG